MKASIARYPLSSRSRVIIHEFLFQCPPPSSLIRYLCKMRTFLPGDYLGLTKSETVHKGCTALLAKQQGAHLHAFSVASSPLTSQR